MVAHRLIGGQHQIREDLLASGNRSMEVWRAGLAERIGRTPPIGLLLYDGPSELDGSRILAITTGLRVGSKNRKTGDLLPTYIIPAGRHPTGTVETGHDKAVCGDCRHRPFTGGSCYVQTSFGAAGVWRARDRYEPVDGPTAAGVLAGASVRFGAWGDPAAVPLHVWEAVYPVLRRFTGYTHQWRQLGASWQWLMASVDTPTEYAEATAAGWRTYRTKGEDDPVLPGERVCLADAHGVPCSKCGGCGGTTGWPERDNYVIDYHGFRVDRAPQLTLPLFGA